MAGKPASIIVTLAGAVAAALSLAGARFVAQNAASLIPAARLDVGSRQVDAIVDSIPGAIT